MNIELIKKYKKEFDHFINDGKLLCSLKDELKWINATEATWSFKDEENIVIIINDEYSHLRKALIEGKTIQIWKIIKQHVSDSSKDIYGWKDFKSFKPNSPFCGPSHHYRIKPEESKFKVGDFVRDIISGKVSQVNNEDIANGKYSQVTKWEPSHKELCWFTNSMTDKSAILRYFKEITENGLFIDTYNTHKGWKYCEPFLNSKPSWFKD